MKWRYTCEVRERGKPTPKPPILEWRVFETIQEADTEEDARSGAEAALEKYCPESRFEHMPLALMDMER